MVIIIPGQLLLENTAEQNLHLQGITYLVVIISSIFFSIRRSDISNTISLNNRPRLSVDADKTTHGC